MVLAAFLLPPRFVLFKVRVNFVKLCSLVIRNELVCEVTAEYPLLFSLPPKLDKMWLREVLASAIRSYFLHHRNSGKCDVVKA